MMLGKITFLVILIGLENFCNGASWFYSSYDVANVAAQLYYPQFSVLQFTYAVATPVEVPGRKLFMNYGLQCNYDLPYNSSIYYNPPYWDGIGPNYESRRLNAEKYNGNNTRMKRDLSAGEVYKTLEQIFSIQGYHEDCIKKMVCEMAKYPLQSEADNLLTEILTFIFTPSMHQAFDSNEKHLREAFEKAEMIGRSDKCCHEVYPSCTASPLQHITNFDEENEI